MRAIFAADKPVFMIDPVSDVGRFALDSVYPKQPTWEQCREIFAVSMQPGIKGFFFSHKENGAEAVAGFMTKTETILDIEDRSRFSRTGNNEVLWVEPLKFWMDCWVKRSLLTIFLRCGMYYDVDGDNFEEAMFGQNFVTYSDKACEYTRKTRTAIMRFLFGFTKVALPTGFESPTGDRHVNLWVELFKEKSVKDIKNILVAERPVQNFGLLGEDALWA